MSRNLAPKTKSLFPLKVPHWINLSFLDLAAKFSLDREPQSIHQSTQNPASIVCNLFFASVLIPRGPTSTLARDNLAQDGQKLCPWLDSLTLAQTDQQICLSFSLFDDRKHVR